MTATAVSLTSSEARAAKVRAALGSPALALALAALFWSGNFVAGRALRGAVDPVTLNFLRWLVALAIIAPFVWRKHAGRLAGAAPGMAADHGAWRHRDRGVPHPDLSRAAKHDRHQRAADPVACPDRDAARVRVAGIAAAVPQADRRRADLDCRRRCPDHSRRCFRHSLPGPFSGLQRRGFVDAGGGRGLGGLFADPAPPSGGSAAVGRAGRQRRRGIAHDAAAAGAFHVGSVCRRSAPPACC